MRELVLDTETTGLDPRDGHRVIEFAGVELIDYIPTGTFWHWYFNPQHERVFSRPGMTPEKFQAILARQWPDALKREQADFVVDTGVPYEGTYRQIDAVVEEIKKRQPLAYQRWADVYND